MTDTMWKLLALSGVVAGLGFLVWQAEQTIKKPPELSDPSMPYPPSKPPALSDPSFPKLPKSQTYLYTPDIQSMFI